MAEAAEIDIYGEEAEFGDVSPYNSLNMTKYLFKSFSGF